jgi:hypothetical protein
MKKGGEIIRADWTIQLLTPEAINEDIYLRDTPSHLSKPWP